MEPPGPLLATGRSADVFAYGAARVLRRNRSGRSADHEAAVMEYVRARGFPVPMILDVRGPDLIMERAEGPSMLEQLTRRPWTVVPHAALLAELHRRLHRIQAPDWIPAPLGEGDRLVHLDLHPGNVLLTTSGPIVIDWEIAGRGVPMADVAKTWILISTSDIVGPWHRRGLERILRRAYLVAFLRFFDRADVLRHLPAVGRERLSDRNVTAVERKVIRRLLAGLEDGGSPGV
jgi:aminoglycoside phosphotransferase (APT) family kinase protein